MSPKNWFLPLDELKPLLFQVRGAEGGAETRVRVEQRKGCLIRHWGLRELGEDNRGWEGLELGGEG